MAKAKTKQVKASVMKVVTPEDAKPAESMPAKAEPSAEAVELVANAKEARANSDAKRASGAKGADVLDARTAYATAKRKVNEYRAKNPKEADAIEDLLA